MKRHCKHANRIEHQDSDIFICLECGHRNGEVPAAKKDEVMSWGIVYTARWADQHLEELLGRFEAEGLDFTINGKEE